MASFGGHGHLAWAARRDLGAMFHYSVAPNAPGGNCAKYGQATLDAVFDDAYELAGTAIQATLDHKDATARTTNEATRLINALFFQPSEEDLAIIQGKMQGVKNWMESGGRINNGQNRHGPLLFCGDTWRVRETMSSQMKDAHGNPMVKENGEPYLISDSREMKKRRKKVAEELGKNPKFIYPHWSEALMAYVFDIKYGDDPTQGPCATDANVIAYTINEGSFGAITLCDAAFNGRRLRSVEASALPSDLFENNQPPSGAVEPQMISKVVPAGRTAYHELFHLYWGNSVMNKGDDEEYNFPRMAGNKLRKNGKMYTKSLAMKNPETYALAAVAYDYTLHVTHTTKKGTYPVEFYTGFCTYEM
ncbi:hypothetical protein Asppvi_008356 [Aspergillus pseudoviridinutans]|uniref:Uncharacterized protein n=1 Tax=Aspergillus pseudoviridinutans TaxID=1517512 RepID=A0A9P3BDP0_9EURO|nr:uncharacterized protein Asppvi_008356 [Aspergillus pseudoviridinutans]GIJ89416.1 hypothetical protein Asppvi_008356 [Aspergillus pseudoviridinutans]